MRQGAAGARLDAGSLVTGFRARARISFERAP